jgi:hypothetical protein
MGGNLTIFTLRQALLSKGDRFFTIVITLTHQIITFCLGLKAIALSF